MLLGLAAALPLMAMSRDIGSFSSSSSTTKETPAMSGSDPDDMLLPTGVRRRTVPGLDGLTVSFLEAGYATLGRPLVLLLHGFPDLAYSWRKTMLPLAEAGYHVVAPDQRGYGDTTGWDNAFDGELASFRTHSYARDALGLVRALGATSVAAVVGHDFGSMVAAYGALVRPDVFKSLVMMSFPFDGPPALPFDIVDKPIATTPPSLAEQLALAATS